MKKKEEKLLIVRNETQVIQIQIVELPEQGGERGREGGRLCRTGRSPGYYTTLSRPRESQKLLLMKRNLSRAAS